MALLNKSSSAKQGFVHLSPKLLNPSHCPLSLGQQTHTASAPIGPDAKQLWQQVPVVTVSNLTADLKPARSAPTSCTRDIIVDVMSDLSLLLSQTLVESGTYWLNVLSFFQHASCL